MKGKSLFSLIGASLGMLILILDSKTALAGAQSGIRLCIGSVIPSLLPFFFLSILLTSGLKGMRWSFLRPVGRLLRIPVGSEPLFLVGLLGGYPVGAQCISQAYEHNSITGQDASRMLAFCNNCGPAFLFGMVGQFFDNDWMIWMLWFIHMLSAVLVATVIPGNPGFMTPSDSAVLSPVQALKRSLIVMAQVCGWVILFRMMITFLQHWFGSFLHSTALVALSGFLELANGCLSLGDISDIGQRFVLCSALLSFGGLCVSMQTMGVVTSALNRSLYFQGKLLQCGIATMLASAVNVLTIRGSVPAVYSLAAMLLSVFCFIFLRISKKAVAIYSPLIYNTTRKELR